MFHCKPPVKIQICKPSLSPHSDFSKALSAYKISICFWTIPSYTALQECCENDLSFHWKCTAKIVWKRSGTFNPCGDLYQCICKALAHMYMCIFWGGNERTLIAFKFQCYIVADLFYIFKYLYLVLINLSINLCFW